MMRHRLLFRSLAAAGLLAATLPAPAQQGVALSKDQRLNGTRVIHPFDPVIDPARAATVVVYGDADAVALGTIVSDDGLILTKASQLEGVRSIGVTLTDKRSFRARLVASEQDNDLALLRVRTKGLTEIEWSHKPLPAVGRWVASPVPGEPFILIGMTSATPRKMRFEGGVMGVVLDRRPRPRWRGVPILEVQPDSGALAAGLRRGDMITHIGDKPTNTPDELIDTVTSHRPGQTVRVTYLRDGRAERGDVVLGYRRVVFSDRFFDRNEPVNGEISIRSTGFDLAIQHHIPLAASLCGGPLIDAGGRVIGLNIARANRSETFALPASLIRQILPKLIHEARPDIDTSPR